MTFKVYLLDVRGLVLTAECETLEEVKCWLRRNDHEGAAPPKVEKVETVAPAEYGYEEY
jgi:hypothetical protein